MWILLRLNILYVLQVLSNFYYVKWTWPLWQRVDLVSRFGFVNQTGYDWCVQPPCRDQTTSVLIFSQMNTYKRKKVACYIGYNPCSKPTLIIFSVTENFACASILPLKWVSEANSTFCLLAAMWLCKFSRYETVSCNKLSCSFPVS